MTMQTTVNEPGPATTNRSRKECLLVVRSSTRVFAFPLTSVFEVTRPLPIEPVPGTPPFLLGLAVIRAIPVPVIDLAKLVGIPKAVSIDRFVVLGRGSRRVAVAAEEVIGLREIENSRLWSLSPILAEADSSVMTSVSVNDCSLLFVLQAARMVPDAFWRDLEPTAVPS
jgi:purine-binding chemotaxis protein CheW